MKNSQILTINLNIEIDQQADLIVMVVTRFEMDIERREAVAAAVGPGRGPRIRGELWNAQQYMEDQEQGIN